MTTITNVIPRKRIITTADDTAILLLSDTGDNLAGMWVFQFVSDPDDPFAGNLVVEGRIQGQNAFDDEVPFAPIPYRAAILNSVADDYTLKSDPITGHSVLFVPATGLAVGVAVSITAGKGILYSYPRQGDAGLP